MSPELVGILGVGAALFVGLGGLNLALWRGVKTELRGVRAEVHGVRAEMRAEIHGVRAEVRDVRADIHNVRAEVRDVRTEMHGVREDMTAANRTLEARLGAVEQGLARLNGLVEGLITAFGQDRSDRAA